MVAEASNKNVGRGIAHHYSDKRCRLHQALEREMKALHSKPPSRQQFMRMIPDSSAEDLSADNCCCPTCKRCGYQVFEVLRSVARDTSDARRTRREGAGDQGHLQLWL